MQFLQDFDLTPLTTFGIHAKARLFAEYASVRELTWISRQPEFLENEVLHIGGGSNLLFLSDFNGLVLHSRILERTIYRKDADTVFAIAGAGENWAEFVAWTIDQGLAGLENLSGIPGNVGASPVQNVGAYGVEAADVIHSVEVFDLESRTTKRLYPKDCGFGYRDSRFKHEWKGKYVVVRVSFRLSPSDMAANVEYGSLKGLSERLGHHPSPAEVAAEVIRIRDSKLPDPREIGSAGSFFKNPIVHRYFYEQEMCRERKDIPKYDIKDDPDHVKVPAGWLIEHAGMKGFRKGGAEVYPKQCLVIANVDHATARDVADVAEAVIHAVRRDFGVQLHPEVNYIDSRMTVTVLGSGTSKGVPEIGCKCRVCMSKDPFDKRLRASVLVKAAGQTILIDASPDFRQQALRQDLAYVDAVLITHSHYDHVGGIDDLRPLCGSHEGPLPLYVSEDVEMDLRSRLDYCFREHLYPGVPTFSLERVSQESVLDINGLKVVPIRVMHGKLPIFGYRIGSFAYVTDAKSIPEEEMWKLENLDVLIVNALRDREHFAHFSVGEALDLIEQVRPKEAYLTHFNHEFGLHHEREATLPPNVHPAYDGLTLHLTY